MGHVEVGVLAAPEDGEAGARVAVDVVVDPLARGHLDLPASNNEHCEFQ